MYGHLNFQCLKLFTSQELVSSVLKVEIETFVRGVLRESILDKSDKEEEHN